MSASSLTLYRTKEEGEVGRRWIESVKEEEESSPVVLWLAHKKSRLVGRVEGIDKVTWYRGFSLFLSRSSRLLVSRAYSRGVRFGISDRCQ